MGELDVIGWVAKGSLLAALSAALVVGTPALASAAGGATRTWVSGVGDDANPCSRTAPCKTWAGAISKTAAGGEIDALDSGGFGAVTITQPITLSATGVTAGVLVAGTNGIVIDTPGDSDAVTLRGLDLNGLAPAGTPGLNGVDIVHAGAVHLENDEIYGFADNGVLFAPTPPSGPGAPTPLLTVEGSQIHDNGQDGILAAVPSGHAVGVVVTNSTVTSNGCGLVATTLPVLAFTSANCGVGSSGSPSATATLTSSQTTVTGSSGTGVLAAGTGATQVLSSDLITANALGVSPVAGGSDRVAGIDRHPGQRGRRDPHLPTLDRHRGPAWSGGAGGAGRRDRVDRVDRRSGSRRARPAGQLPHGHAAADPPGAWPAPDGDRLPPALHDGAGRRVGDVHDCVTLRPPGAPRGRPG